jgi:predicted negative regulator of RcsB-dependent stress response
MDNSRQDVRTIGLDIENKHSEFTSHITRLGALACAFSDAENNDLKKAEKKLCDGLQALGAKDALEEMLIAQMLSIHQLQQISISMASEIVDIKIRQYFCNTAIKLTNAFVQQATLLNKLQNREQKIIVEHVDVHHGGYAVLGNISVCPTIEREKK